MGAEGGGSFIGHLSCFIWGSGGAGVLEGGAEGLDDAGGFFWGAVVVEGDEVLEKLLVGEVLGQATFTCLPMNSRSGGNVRGPAWIGLPGGPGLRGCAWARGEMGWCGTCERRWKPMQHNGGSSFKTEFRRTEIASYSDYLGDASPPG